VFTKVTAYQTSAATYLSKSNSHASTLLNMVNTISNSKQSVASSDVAVKEKTLILQELKEGADEIDLKTQQLNVQQRQNSLLKARQVLADYTIRASFDGIISDVTIKVGETATGTVGTLVTKQKIAEISLNELDVAKVKLGQKATLTFDALEDLSITGQVAEVDQAGTANQGVVSYTVKIALDTQDDNIKSGMTVSADIITDVRQDVLLVPSSSVKTKSGLKYVQVLDGSGLPQSVTVEVGLSNDTMTEIISGLDEGTEVVTQTVSSSTTTTSIPGNNSLIPGIGGAPPSGMGSR
jgi:RND family efflux transporter MFP subunit